MANLTAPCLDCGTTASTNRREVCGRCYSYRRYHKLPLPPSTKQSLEKHLAASRRGDAECWPWAGFVDKQGYGAWAGDGTYRGAHRLSYEREIGPVPDGYELDHTCHTNDPTCTAGNTCPHRACVNPAHLEPVPHPENVRRKHVVLAETCHRGHPLSGDNLYLHQGTRHCRECRREASTDSYRKRTGASPLQRLIAGGRCPQGHLLDDANLHVAPNGKKVCRVCRRNYHKTRRRRAGVSPKVTIGTHCPSGHEMNGENLRYDGKGNKYCQACSRVAKKRWREKIRAAGHVPS